MVSVNVSDSDANDILSLLRISRAVDNITTAAATTAATTPGINEVAYLENERFIEGMYLMVTALVGIALNIVILLCVFVCRTLRHYMNGFIVHACFLDAFKSAMCIPYSLAVLQLITPSYCNALGLAYVVSLTVSMFNLLAMVMAEAYVFHERNVNDLEGGRHGSAMCVLFGVVTIYIGSIILHLGPTLIGGEFSFNPDIGNCIFSYGKVQNYIVQVIWVIIVTLTLIVVFRYIYKFYRQLKANQRFRITNLARNAAAYTKGEDGNDDIYPLVNKLKRRVLVLLLIAAVYCFCWYPLFFLTLLDYAYTQPRYMYRALTVAAWSHSALNPIILLTIDPSIGLMCQIRKACRKRKHYKTSSASTQPLTREDSNMHGNQHTSLYNNTMNNSRKDSNPVSSPRSMNSRYHPESDGETSKLGIYSDSEEIPPPPPSPPQKHLKRRPPCSPSSGPLFDYDALSLEESPL